MQIKSNKLICFGLVLFTIMTIGIVSADPLNVELVSHFGGNAYDIDVVGDYAYLGQGQDLVVMDVSADDRSTEMGRITTSSVVRSVDVSGNYVYVANDDGLVLIDVTNPSSPKILDIVEIEGSPRDVAVRGNYSYIVSTVYSDHKYYYNLEIVDAGNLTSLKSIGFYDSEGFVNVIDVKGNYAYLADRAGGLTILNVTEPSSPEIEGSINGRTDDVVLSGNYAYTIHDGYLNIENITDPVSPTLVSGYVSDIGIMKKVAISGNYAYLLTSAYLADEYHDMLEIVDISNATAPVYKSTYFGDDQDSMNSIAIAGNYAYIADDYGGFMKVDVTNPNSPELADKYDSAGSVSDVAVSGDYAYLAESGNGLVIVDISNKKAPLVAGSYATSNDAYGIELLGKYAYLGTHWFCNINSLHIIDITDPSSPTMNGLWAFQPDRYGTTVADNYAYITNYDTIDIVSVDMREPSSPRIMSSVPIEANDIAAAGNYAYIYADGEGFVILNATDPSSPKIEGSYDIGGNIALSENYAYVANGENGLVILDVSDPASPELAGSYNSISASDVVISENYAYVTGNTGMVILDIANQTSPTLAGTYSIVGNSVAVEGDYIYIANGDRGLTILHMERSDKTALPTSITKLKETAVSTNWINWTWTNPLSTEFSHVMVHIDGKFVLNTSEGHYNLTGLDEGTTHTISTKTVFSSGNINDTWVNDSAQTLLPVDTIAPASITDLKEENTGASWIKWIWVNPTEPDFSHVMVYADNEFVANSSNGYYNLTGLAEGTTHVISTRTVDMSGNINSRWVNDSAKTIVSTDITPIVLPTISELTGKEISSSSITLTWTNSLDVSIVSIYRNGTFVGNVSVVTSFIDSGLASSAAYNYSLIPYNKDGVAGKTASVVLNTGSQSSNGESSSSGSSSTSNSGGSSSSKSSSGGSGGAASTEDFTNVALKDVDTEYLRMGSNVTYEFSREGNNIQAISFYSLRNSGEVTSSIEVLNNRSKMANSDPEGFVYKYVNIWVGKVGFATADNIKDAEIKFKVSNSWIRELGISSSDVKLQRYNGTTWEVLPTTLESNTTEYAVFEASTPGFSPFAITGERQIAASLTDEEETVSIPTADVGVEETRSDRSSIWTLMMAILMIGVLAVGYAYVKRKQR